MNSFDSPLTFPSLPARVSVSDVPDRFCGGHRWVAIEAQIDLDEHLWVVWIDWSDATVSGWEDMGPIEWRLDRSAWALYPVLIADSKTRLTLPGPQPPDSAETKSEESCPE